MRFRPIGACLFTISGFDPFDEAEVMYRFLTMDLGWTVCATIAMEASDETRSAHSLINLANISGVVVVEGVSDQAVKAKLQRMSIGVSVTGFRGSAGDGGDYEFPDVITAKIAGDGAFSLRGARPGMASFHM